MILDGFDIGGTETHVLSLSNELIKAGIYVVVAGRKGKLYEQFKNIGCSIYLIKNTKNEFEKQIKRIIEIERINLVHLHHPPSGIAAFNLLTKLKIPNIFTIHGLYYKNAIPYLNKYTKVISVSEPVKRYLLMQSVESILIPNGVDTNTFYRKNNNSLRRELGIPQNAFVVLYVSRIAWGKSTVCTKLINTCNNIRKTTKKDIQVVIVGSGQHIDLIKKQSKVLNSNSNKEFIHLLGERLDLVDCYGASDCVVGTGRVALEAMACEKPVIAMGSHGYFGLIEPKVFNEAWEYYFGDHYSCDNNNTNKLKKSLKSIISSTQNKLQGIGESSRNWIVTKFNIKNISKEIIRVYLELLRKEDI